MLRPEIVVGVERTETLLRGAEEVSVAAGVLAVVIGEEGIT